MLSEERKNNYVAHPFNCPYCGSDNITGGEVDFNDVFIYRDIYCKKCNKSFNEQFKLVGIEENDSCLES